MPVEYRLDDILESDCKILVNTVNCVGVMGAGLALQFKQRYPDMYRDYQAACASGDVQIGRLHPYEASDGKVILNFPTKQHWKNPSRIEWIERGLAALRYWISWDTESIAIPQLGCSNGGLNWHYVRPKILAMVDELPQRAQQARICLYGQPPDVHLYRMECPCCERAMSYRDREFLCSCGRRYAMRQGRPVIGPEDFAKLREPGELG